MFVENNSSSTHADNRKKDVLVLRERSKQGLDNIKIPTEANYSINFTASKRNFVYESNISQIFFMLFVYNNYISMVYNNGIHQFKTKDSEIKTYLLCLGNIAKILQLITRKRLD